MPYPANSTTFGGGNNNNATTTAQPAAPPLIGPRGKCDQVIFEAMTKACEIIIRGRCTDLELKSSSTTTTAATGRGNGSSSSSSRFNIQVDEVPSVRSILQTWKRALNIPLRLDIFYEYTDTSAGGGGGVQRELLERWCIDYKNVNHAMMLSNTASSSSKIMTGATTSSSASSSTSAPSSSSSQLRLVCKRIVVLLRNLHCMTRMLPGYRLQSLIDNSGNNSGGRDGICINNNNVRGNNLGIIGYSIYASDSNEPNGPILPSPSFTQQTFPVVKTPFGQLGLCVMYDATLNPHQMVEDVVERLLGGEDELWNQQQQQQVEEDGVGLDKGGTEGDVGQQSQQATLPIPVPPPESISSTTPGETLVHTSGALLAQHQGRGDGSRREFGSCPTKLLLGRSRSSSLGGGGGGGAAPGRTRAVSDLIITDYHSSPAIKARASSSVGNSPNPAGNEKRIMSGLSLAMMADENGNNSQQQHHQTAVGGDGCGMPISPDEYSEQVDTVVEHTWGSLATRAAFHHPPPTYESPGTTSDDFFQYHGGYGYGYNGSQVQLNTEVPSSPFPPVESVGSRGTNDGLSMSPSPLMSTPPPHYSEWMKRRQSSAAENIPSSLKENLGDSHNSDRADKDDEDAPPFVNPTSLQDLPASGTLSGSAPISPRPSSSFGSSPQHHDLRNDSQRRQSSSSVLLPPVTSLDLLQKSPFTAKSNAEKNDDKLAMPFSLGSYRDEMFMSSIPKMVAAGPRSRTSSLATSGGNPFMASFGQSSSAGGYYSTGPFASSSRREIHSFSQSEVADEAEEMPFALALDEEGPFAKSSSRSLMGSTKGDLASSSLAVSSLHQRCDQGKPRLKMFSHSRTRSSSSRNDDEIKFDKDTTSAADYSSIKDQLSEFRTWHSASLMVESTSSR